MSRPTQTVAADPIFRLPPLRVEAMYTALAETVDWGLAAYHVPEHWKSTRGKGVRVAVLDTGLDMNHPDLAGAVEDACDFTDSPRGAADGQGHGTHVAGTIAARRNEQGVVGVAPECRLLVGKVLGDDGSGTSDQVARGIDWAVAAGADILSLSLGSPDASAAIKAAIERAIAAGRFVILLRLFLLFDLLAVQVLAGRPVNAASPASELAAAVDDLSRNVAPAEWRDTRYVSFYYATEQQRDEQRAVLAFVLNSVSRQARLIAPAVVDGTHGSLVRINLDDFKIPADTWEALVADREPYWHITTEVLDPRTSKKTTVYTDGGWVNLDAARRLREVTASGGAIVRGDWFIAKATTPPHYYRLAGIGATLADWHKLVGVDQKAIVALRANHGANLITSGVTRKPRRISRWQGPAGGVWQTYDTFGDDPAKDPLRDPTFAGGYDASEHIAAKANGLHLFALFDAKGTRQDAVPDRLAKDDTDPHGDGVLVPMLSCVRCHVEDGLRPFVDDQQRLLAGDVKLLAEVKDTADSLAAFYNAARLEKQAARDREDYAAAVAEATGGMTTKALVAALTATFGEYQNTLVTPESATRELGVERMESLRASRDPILLALAAGISVQRQQWEASFAEAALLATRAHSATK